MITKRRAKAVQSVVLLAKVVLISLALIYLASTSRCPSFGRLVAAPCGAPPADKRRGARLSAGPNLQNNRVCGIGHQRSCTLPDDVPLRHESPVPAVEAVVPIVAHHEVVAFRHDLRAPIIVAAVTRKAGTNRPSGCRCGNLAGDDPHRVTFLRDDALDERLLRLVRVVQHDDIADMRLADPPIVCRLVDDIRQS